MAYSTGVKNKTEPSGELRGTMAVHMHDVPDRFHAVEVTDGTPSATAICGGSYDDVRIDLPWRHGAIRAGYKVCANCKRLLDPASAAAQ